MTRRLRPRSAATTWPTAVLLAAALPILTGCGAGFGAATNQTYTPGGGVDADSGDMLVRGATLVAAEPGGPAILVAGLVNEGDGRDRLTEVTLVEEGQPATLPSGGVKAAPGQLTRLGADADATVSVTGPPDALRPGHFIRVRFTFKKAGSVVARLLIQPPRQEYATETPPPTPTETAPAATPTPSPTDTPR